MSKIDCAILIGVSDNTQHLLDYTVISELDTIHNKGIAKTLWLCIITTKKKRKKDEQTLESCLFFVITSISLNFFNYKVKLNDSRLSTVSHSLISATKSHRIETLIYQPQNLTCLA